MITKRITNQMLTSLLLACLLVFTVAGCGTAESAKEAATTMGTAALQEEVTTTEAPTDAPTEAPTTVEITTTVTEPNPPKSNRTDGTRSCGRRDRSKGNSEEISGEIFSIARGHDTKLIIEADKIIF